MKLFGKKFIFATIAIICVSVTACLQGYAGDIYLKLVLAIVTIFTVSQTIADKGGK